jgi:subtilisin family serine protease
VPARSAGEYELTPGDVNSGMEWAAEHAQIANVSIGSASPLTGLQNTIRLHPDLLVVTAAGNETQPLTDYPLYPANYGGSNHEVGDQVITVAAYDGNLARATFSNWSREYADVMAPGCDIPYQTDGTARLYGTSFAAPLVSMTAGLLWAFGVKGPKEIKRRMQASVDFDQHFQDLVAWSGRLNIAKTLSVYDDVLEFSAYDDVLKKKLPILKFGRWQTPNADLCGDKGIDFSDIDKVSVVNDKVPSQIRILYRDGLKVPRAWECEPVGTGLTLVDKQGVSYDVLWADFIDLVPRYFNRQ